jgi:anaerobic selenocysteine-containing dehydrogenase
MCTSRCGVLATVEDGRLTRVAPDADHPNGCICVKGTAAPDIVYSPDRLLHPVVRSRPKGDPDPGWVRVSWEQALSLVATRLSAIKNGHGPQAVVFSRATTAGTAAIDFDGWLQRLANAFGSPNLLTSNHICTWNRRVGSKYTYGTGMPLPDFDHARCMLLWGVNPAATSPAQALRIKRARKRGAKLIVIDPRKTPLAESADCWLRVRPGADGELAMAMIHVLIEENLYEREFTRGWTNAPYLVRADNGRLLSERDRFAGGNLNAPLIWDERIAGPVAARQSTVHAALTGEYRVTLASGETIACMPALECLKRIAEKLAPERSAALTTVSAREVRQAVRLFATEKPSCYCTWVGLEQDRDALQTNRAVCCFYALTGQFDQPGSNVLFETAPMNPIAGRELLPKAMAGMRLGAEKHPLGPQSDPGLVQAAEVYEAILTAKPYPLKALVLFGTDPLLGHGDPRRGKAALQALDFYLHVDSIINPSAAFADLVLPASTCWEREALMPFFEIAGDTMNWVQLRPAAIAPLGESRSDTEIIFELATRLELGEEFFGGDIDAALNHQIGPSGLTVERLRASPIGIRVPAQTRYRKYAENGPANGQPIGFATPSGKIEIFSTALSDSGYAALPEFRPRAASPDYPLSLTFFRLIHFCDDHHRNIARLRRAVPDPFLDINPQTAKSQGIGSGDWISLETAAGKVRLKARFNESLHPLVVATVYGWWQGCAELKLSGYDPFSAEGANVNTLIPNSDKDPISASVAHRGQRCRVSRL